MVCSAPDPRQSVPLLEPALSCQSLFAIRSAPLPSRSSSVGLASALGTPKAVRLGPMPRTTILSLPLLLPRMKARDHDVVTRADKGPRADIGQLRQHGLTEVVDFNQGDT